MVKGPSSVQAASICKQHNLGVLLRGHVQLLYSTQAACQRGEPCGIALGWGKGEREGEKGMEEGGGSEGEPSAD